MNPEEKLGSSPVTRISRQAKAEEDLHENEMNIYPDKKTTVIFEFMFRPEYLGVDNKVIINTDQFKALGVIKQVMSGRIDTALGGASATFTPRGSSQKRALKKKLLQSLGAEMEQ